MNRDIFQKHFKIQDRNGNVGYFIPNKAQKHFNKVKTGRDVILKARQLGLSTDMVLGHLDRAMANENLNCITIAHTVPDASKMLRKVKYAFKNLPPGTIKRYAPDFDNVNELFLGWTQSSVSVSSSGRSGTYQRVHISELDMMTKQQQDEVFLGTLQTVPADGEVIIESTARGYGKMYELYQECLKGNSVWTFHFYNWAWDESYQDTPPSSDDWKQDFSRLIDQYKLLHTLKDGRILDQKLTNKQLYWYYKKVVELGREAAKIKAEFPCIASEAFMTSGDMAFNAELLLQHEETIEPGNTIGSLTIWREPVKGHRYILSADTSEGSQSGDWQNAYIIDCDEGEAVARIRERVRPDIFATHCAMLGTKYTEESGLPCWIAIERNNHGHSVLNTLSTHVSEYTPYRYLYEHEDGKLGWITNKITKPLMLTSAEGLIPAVENNIITIHDRTFLEEARVFENKKNGTMGAKEGSNDDCVISMAIGWYLISWRANKGMHGLLKQD